MRGGNSLGNILEVLEVSRDAVVLDIGGAAFDGEESLRQLQEYGIARIEAVVAKADKRAILESRFPDVRLHRDWRQLALQSYDMVVVSSPIGDLARNLQERAPSDWRWLLKPGGILATFAGDPQLMAASAKPPPTAIVDFFNGTLNPAQVAESGQLPGFLAQYRHLMHARRKPGSSYLLWFLLGLREEPAGPEAARSQAFADMFEARYNVSPLDAFLLLEKDRPIDERLLHRALERLFSDKRIPAYRQAVDLVVDRMDGIVALYHMISLDKFGGRPSAALVWARDWLRGAPPDHFLYRALFALVVDQTVRHGGADVLKPLLLEEFLAQTPYLPLAVAVGCAAALCEMGDEASAARFIDHYCGNKDALIRLAFSETESRMRAAGADGPAGESWRGLVARFADLRRALTGPRAGAEQEICELLLSLPDGPSDFMDIRTVPAKKQALLVRISEALTRQQPLSLVRLGDGEAYAFSGTGTQAPSLQADADNRVRECLWWGEAVADGTRDIIKAEVREAVLAADILGIPSIFRLIRDTVGQGGVFGDHAAQRGLETVLRSLLASPPPGKLWTEERCNHLLFTRKNLEDMATHAQQIVWVSCWDESQIPLAGSAPQVFIKIPAHTRVAGATSTTGAGSLPDLYGAKVAEMASHVAPGSLVLVAAGLVGKIFIARARERGGVAIDLGAMADYFAGFKTRSVADIL